MKKLFFTLACTIQVLICFSQVTKVNYQLRYNVETKLYDFYIYIKEGQAINYVDRVQLSMGMSLVVPTGSTVSIDSAYMPLVGNQYYNGTNPAFWIFSNQIYAPAITPLYDYYYVTVSLFPFAAYNNLMEGMFVRLISLNINTPQDDCDANVRLWNNETDPDPEDEGMGGAEFDNGFTIGNVEQRYDGNLPEIRKGIYLKNIFPGCGDGIQVFSEFAPNGNQGPLTFAWTGPDGSAYSTQNISINPSSPDQEGMYQLIVTDTVNCVDTFTVSTESMINAGEDAISCGGNTIQLFGKYPNSGNWEKLSTNPTNVNLINEAEGRATISFADTDEGLYGFLYTKADCNDTAYVRVYAKPNIEVSDNEICVEEEVLLDGNPSGGTWTVEDPTIVSISSEGLVKGLSAGSTVIRYVSIEGCRSDSVIMTVLPQPIVAMVGNPSICEGNKFQLSPMAPTWSSSDQNIVSVTTVGMASAINDGLVNLIYTDDNTCTNSISITVNPIPDVQITGDTVICNLGGTSTLSPTSGGTWSSTNNSVATVTNAGLVIGVGIGCTTFLFTNNMGCESRPTDIICVAQDPDLSTISTEMCLGSFMQLPNIPGYYWESLTPSIITVLSSPPRLSSNSVGEGIVTLISTQGCEPDTLTITVHPKATLTLDGSNTICPGGTTLISASLNGNFFVSNPSVATVSSGGLITGISAGNCEVSHTSINGCISDPVIIHVPQLPSIIQQFGSLCVGSTGQLLPNQNVAWYSSNTDVIIMQNDGKAIGVAPGVTNLYFEDLQTGCKSILIPVTVEPSPTVLLVGPDEICVGETTSAIPTTGGTWISQNPSIATISNNGLISGINQGVASFTYTNFAGCTSNSIKVTVMPSNASFINQYGPFCNTDAPIALEALPSGGMFSGPGVVGNVFDPSLLQPGFYSIMYDIGGNEPCNFAITVIEVKDCSPTYPLSVLVYFDENRNGVYDSSSEFGLPNAHVFIEEKNMLFLTNSSGQVHTDLKNSTYNLKVSLPYGSWDVDTQMVIVTINDQAGSIAVPFTSESTIENGLLSVNAGILRCNQWVKMNVGAINLSSNNISGKVVLELDPITYARNAVPLPLTQNLERIIWQVNDVHPGENRNSMVEIFATMPNVIGDSLRFYTYFISSSGDTLNTNYYADMIRCSYDPNDKRSWPDRLGNENYTLRQEHLSYTIRFQNTGNDTAFYVRVDDHLDQALNVGSLMVLDASHDLVTCYEDNGILSFIFNDIALTDSSTNYSESEGYITFAIDEYIDVPEKTEIFNSVDIYFDQNPPIKTNTVKNTIVTELPCLHAEIDIDGTSLLATIGGSYYRWYNCESNELIYESAANGWAPASTGRYYVVIDDVFCKAKSECILFDGNGIDPDSFTKIKIIPNPAKDFLSIVSEVSIQEVILYNAMGMKIKTWQNNTLDLNVSNMHPGIYMLYLSSEEGSLIKRVVIE